MTASTMRRQVQRLREELDAIKPQPERKVHLLAEPGADATEAERRAYEKKVAQAEAAGEMVIALVGVKPAPQVLNRPGVIRKNSRVDALLTVLALKHSEHGKANRLADVLDNMPSKVIEPVPCSALKDSEDDRND